MKKLFLVSFCLFLGACTKSELKKKALQEAKNQYEQTLEDEVKDVSMPGVLHENYLSYLKNTAAYDVVDLKMPDDSHATVSVTVEAVAAANRHTLAKIAAGLKDSQAGTFNMGDAINLIEQQPGQVRGKTASLYILKYHKSGGNWILDK